MKYEEMTIHDLIHDFKYYKLERQYKECFCYAFFIIKYYVLKFFNCTQQ